MDQVAQQYAPRLEHNEARQRFLHALQIEDKTMIGMGTSIDLCLRIEKAFACFACLMIMTVACMCTHDDEFAVSRREHGCC